MHTCNYELSNFISKQLLRTRNSCTLDVLEEKHELPISNRELASSGPLQLSSDVK